MEADHYDPIQGQTAHVLPQGTSHLPTSEQSGALLASLTAAEEALETEGRRLLSTAIRRTLSLAALEDTQTPGPVVAKRDLRQWLLDVYSHRIRRVTNDRQRERYSRYRLDLLRDDRKPGRIKDRIRLRDPNADTIHQVRKLWNGPGRVPGIFDNFDLPFDDFSFMGYTVGVLTRGARENVGLVAERIPPFVVAVSRDTSMPYISFGKLAMLDRSFASGASSSHAQNSKMAQPHELRYNPPAHPVAPDGGDPEPFLDLNLLPRPDDGLATPPASTSQAPAYTDAVTRMLLGDTRNALAELEQMDENQLVQVGPMMLDIQRLEPPRDTFVGRPRSFVRADDLLKIWLETVYRRRISNLHPSNRYRFVNMITHFDFEIKKDPRKDDAVARSIRSFKDYRLAQQRESKEGYGQNLPGPFEQVHGPFEDFKFGAYTVRAMSKHHFVGSVPDLDSGLPVIAVSDDPKEKSISLGMLYVQRKEGLAPGSVAHKAGESSSAL